jgi:hypothetical protein
MKTNLVPFFAICAFILKLGVVINNTSVNGWGMKRHFYSEKTGVERL